MADITLDCRGLVCPLPVAKVQGKSRDISAGQTLEVIADCSTFLQDIQEWCEKTEHPIMSQNTTEGITTVVIQF